MDAAAYLPIVKVIARTMMRRLPSSVEVDDLIQAGSMGVFEALPRYDANHSPKASVEAFIRKRAHGAMLDFLRLSDPLSRGVRRKMRQASEAARQLEAKHGHPPRESDIAEAVGLQLDEYQWLRLLGSDETFSIDNEAVDLPSVGATPEQLHEQADFDAALDRAIKRLSARHQRALLGIYIEGKTFTAMADELGVTVSRVSHMNKTSLEKLRARLV